MATPYLVVRLKDLCRSKQVETLRDEGRQLGRLAIGCAAALVYIGGEGLAERLVQALWTDGPPPVVELAIVLLTVLGLVAVVGWLLRAAKATLQDTAELVKSFKQHFGRLDVGGGKGGGGPDGRRLSVVPAPAEAAATEDAAEVIEADLDDGRSAEIMVTALMAAAIVIMWMNGPGGPTGGMRS